MIYFFLAEGFEEMEALAPADLLRRAGKEVTLVGVGGTEITGAHGITVRADLADADYKDPSPEAVVLPGGMPGTKHLAKSACVLSALRDAKAAGSVLAAICAAPSVLAENGYLAGKKATCYPGYEEVLRAGGACVEDPRRAPVVTDGDVITAAGAGAAVAFGLTLVEKFCGARTAEELRYAIVS